MIPPHELFSKLQLKKCESLPLWPFSVLTLKRNLSGVLYPSKLSPSAKIDTERKLKEAIVQSHHLTSLASVSTKSLTQTQLGFLKERLLLPSYFTASDQEYSMLIDPENNITSLFNIENHLTLHLLDDKNEWHESIKKLYEVENFLSEKLNFSFSPKFGYLTSSLDDVGTGLKVFLYLHLPLLYKYYPKEKLHSLLKDEVTTTLFPLNHNSPNPSGHLVVLTNTYLIGITEDHLFKHLYNSAQNLINEERKLRNEAKLSQDGEIKDMISKAFGVSKHSYQMNPSDALETISLLKLGFDLGWIQNGSDAFFNQLFFEVQDSHILLQNQKEITEDNLPHLRAEIIHKALQTLSLKMD